MRRTALPHEDQALGFGWALTGVVLMASAALSADMAVAHSQALGVVCGAGFSPHCGWCLGVAGLALAGLAAFSHAASAARRIRKSGLLQIKAGSRSS